MRPKRNILVVGIRPELRFALRIVSRSNIWPAETMLEVIDFAEAICVDLAVIDYRDSKGLAEYTVDWLVRNAPSVRRIQIVSCHQESTESEYAVIRDGYHFWDRLYFAVGLSLRRNRGPVRKLHTCQ
jgi:hypothetical protein